MFYKEDGVIPLNLFSGAGSGYERDRDKADREYSQAVQLISELCVRAHFVLVLLVSTVKGK
jgi:hypothetical protein